MLENCREQYCIVLWAQVNVRELKWTKVNQSELRWTAVKPSKPKQSKPKWTKVKPSKPKQTKANQRFTAKTTPSFSLVQLFVLHPAWGIDKRMDNLMPAEPAGGLLALGWVDHYKTLANPPPPPAVLPPHGSPTLSLPFFFSSPLATQVTAGQGRVPLLVTVRHTTNKLHFRLQPLKI